MVLVNFQIRSDYFLEFLVTTKRSQYKSICIPMDIDHLEYETLKESHIMHLDRKESSINTNFFFRSFRPVCVCPKYTTRILYFLIPF